MQPQHFCFLLVYDISNSEKELIFAIAIEDVKRREREREKRV